MQSCTPRSSGEHVFLNMKRVGGTFAYWLELPQVPAEGTFLFKTQGKEKQTQGKRG